MRNSVNLFQLQTELIDGKVDMTVSKAIIPVLEKIENLRYEMHQEIGGLRTEMHQEIGALKQEMNTRFSTVDTRLSAVEREMSAVETALGMRNQSKAQVKAHFLNYSFKAGWLLAVAAFSVTLSFLAAHLHP